MKNLTTFIILLSAFLIHTNCKSQQVNMVNKTINKTIEHKVEPGDFNVWIGGDSNAPLKISFTVVE